ncbi:hypothetical protein GUITHDRAFT_47433, partial [Guillardia theta CCMP2712]
VDIFGNKLTNGGDLIIARIINGPSVGVDAINVIDNQNGTYSVRMTATRSGRYEIKISLNGLFNVFSFSPINLNVTAATPTASIKFTIQPVDKYGIYFTKSVLNFSVAVALEDNFFELKAVDNLDGSFIVQYELTKAGAYSMSIILEMNHIQGSPF